MANSGKAQNGNRQVDLEDALAGASGATRGLRETATQARAIEDAATRLAASGNEQAAANEQIRASLEALAAGVEQAATSSLSLARAQANVAETAKEVQIGQE